MRIFPNSRRCGFTLIELLIVITIIGILISLILVAANDGIRRAEERQTQALIAKLETALTDRLDALLATTAPINQTHRYLAAITYPDPQGNNGSGAIDPIAASVDRRAQVIAQFDLVKAEFPDVFYLSGVASYPVNFGMAPYPLTANPTLDNFILPLGNRNPGLPYIPANPNDLTPPPPTTGATGTYVPTPGYTISGASAGFNTTGVATADLSPGLVVAQDSGIFGASFTAAAGLYKNLYETAAADVGVNPTIVAKRGYDAADNDNDGYVDNIGEVTLNDPTATPIFVAAVNARLAKHDHKTARSEMLYALLVEGQGPLGSVYNREDFTNRDVADTDGDGLPEFIDAWGQPLQFYRWPIYSGSVNQTAIVGSSGSQMGFQPYNFNNVQNTPRQLDPLDANQLLVSVGWWTQGPAYNTGLPTMNVVAPGVAPNFSASNPLFASSPASPQANAFMTYFHILIDPQLATPPTSGTNYLTPNWDRTGSTRRRAYFSKFLVLSGGPDQEIGVFRLNKDYLGDIGTNDLGNSLAPAFPSGGFPTGNPINDAVLVNWCEGQAAPVDYGNRSGPFLEMPYGNNSGLPSATSYYLQNGSSLDDITNQTLSAPGSGAK